jgi:uncharacterized protein
MSISSSSQARQRQNRTRSRRDWRRQLRYYYWRLLRLQGSHQEMARGLASGVFAGCFPLFGLQTIIGIAIATLVRGNRILAAAGTWVSNPLTYFPLFAFNYQVGHWALGGGPRESFADLDSLRGWMEMGAEVTTRLMLGSTLVGIFASLAGYYLGIVLLRRLHDRRRRYRLRQR